VLCVSIHSLAKKRLARSWGRLKHTHTQRKGKENGDFVAEGY